MIKPYVIDVTKTFPIIILIDYRKKADFKELEKTLKDSISKMIMKFKNLNIDTVKIDFYFIFFGDEISNFKIDIDDSNFKFGIEKSKTYEEALNQAKKIIESKKCWPSNAYWPTIMTIFNGITVEEYKNSVQLLRKRCLNLKAHWMSIYLKIENSELDLGPDRDYDSYKDIYEAFSHLMLIIKMRLESKDPNDIPRI